MTKEQQQIVTKSRQACEWLAQYLARQQKAGTAVGPIGDLIAWECMHDLIAGFRLLDAGMNRDA